METTFKSDNIQLCSYLLAHGVLFVDVIEDTWGHFIFELSNPQLCNKLELSFINNGSAPAKLLFEKREMLINQIKNRNNNKYGKR